MIAGPRLACCVPWCRRTISRASLKTPEGLEISEWICGHHWRGIRKSWRQLYQRLKWKAAQQGITVFERRKFIARAELTWTKLKRMAVERAAGIG